MFRSLFLIPLLYIVLAAAKPLAKPTEDVAISENMEMDSNAFPTVESQDAATPWDLKVENVKEEAFAGATPSQLSDERLIRATPWGLLKRLRQGEVEEKTTWQPLEGATPWGLQDIATPWDRVLLPNLEKVTRMH